MDLAELGRHRRRRRAVGDLPAGDMKRLAERRDHEAARHQRRIAAGRGVGLAVEDHVLVDLVGDHEQVVRLSDGLERAQVVIAQDAPARVVRRIDQDRPGARRDSRFDARPSRSRNSSVIGTHTGLAAGQHDVGQITVVHRLDRR
jgi:hypothetical protein